MKKTKNIKVSVVIPVYNQEELVIKALDSIPKRDDIEVIVVNDGSTDNTYKVLKAYNRLDLRLYNNNGNIGLANTLNVAYDVAKGEYIVNLDSDDYFYTNEFEKCIEELDGTDLIYYDLKVNSGEVWNLNEESKNYLCGQVKFYRREFIGNTRYIKDLRTKEDYWFYQDLMKKNPTEKFTNLVVKHYNFPRKGSLYDLTIRGLI